MIVFHPVSVFTAVIISQTLFKLGVFTKEGCGSLFLQAQPPRQPNLLPCPLDLARFKWIRRGKKPRSASQLKLNQPGDGRRESNAAWQTEAGEPSPGASKVKKKKKYLVNVSPVQAPCQMSTLGAEDWYKVHVCLGSVLDSETHACMTDRFRSSEFINGLIQANPKFNARLFVICTFGQMPTQNKTTAPSTCFWSTHASVFFSSGAQKWKIFRAQTLKFLPVTLSFSTPLSRPDKSSS